LDPDFVEYIASEIASVHSTNLELGVVVGGGNIWRGAQAEATGMDRATADHAGMLATIINALALQDALERNHLVQTRTQSAINVSAVAEQYIRRRAIRHLEKGRVVIFAAGTGNPFMTTDTTAALRAAEIDADIILMAKHGVDGIYTSDPNINPDASKIDNITHFQAIERRLNVMDSTALSMCMENHLPIVVFDMFQKGNIRKIIEGEQIGSVVSNG